MKRLGVNLMNKPLPGGDIDTEDSDQPDAKNPLAQDPKPGLKSAQVLFLIVFLLLIFIGSIAQAWHFEYGMIITQVLIVLLPAIWYWRRYKLNQVQFSRLAPLELKYLPPIFIMVASFWLLNMIFAGALVLGLMELGFEPIVVIEPPRTLQEYLGYLLVLSVFAGICEEVLFRGTIMPSMEGHGLVPAIVYSSLLFALLHGSLLNLVSTFTLGLIMAVIVIKTGSLWAGIIYHMLNNFIAATYLYLAGQNELTAAVEVDPRGYLAVLPLLVLGVAGAWFSLTLLHRQSGAAPLLKNRSGWLPRGWLYWPFIAGLVIYAFLAFFELAIGFSWINLPGLY
jgi:membrane protease YdiL (CAAX protease family)